MAQEKTNPVLADTIRSLREAGNDNDAAIWHDAADILANPSRDLPTINLDRLNRNTEDGDTVIIPGKVLGSGRLDNELTVAAFQFSSRARKRINNVGTAVPLRDFVDEHPSGSNIRLMQ